MSLLHHHPALLCTKSEQKQTSAHMGTEVKILLTIYDMPKVSSSWMSTSSSARNTIANIHAHEA